MPISSRSVVSTTIILLAIGFVALIGIVGATLWLGERANSYFTEVFEVRDQRTATLELRNALYVAESAQRGFVVTANEIYLAPYDVARSEAERRRTDLQQVFAGHPQDQAAVTRLGEIVDEKFAEMDEVIGLIRAGQVEEAQAVFRTNRGKALMDEANVYFSALVQEADSRLFTGLNEQQNNAFWQRLISGLGAIL
ncbi:MAG TPA: CHASE3 domain-containing protein, partial [Microvirga sp.]|nr:CHASE3 domain-containing protein [Microvirga sp.]